MRLPVFVLLSGTCSVMLAGKESKETRVRRRSAEHKAFSKHTGLPHLHPKAFLLWSRRPFSGGSQPPF